MNSQYENNKSLCLDKNKNFLNEIVDMKKFRELDDRYLITDICNNINLKYEFNDDRCNVYYKSFSFSISFNKNNFKLVACFVDPKSISKNDEDKFILFLKNIITNKQLEISTQYLRSILNKVLNGSVKTVKDTKDKYELYAGKILNDGRELFFMTINLNA